MHVFLETAQAFGPAEGNTGPRVLASGVRHRFHVSFVSPSGPHHGTYVAGGPRLRLAPARRGRATGFIVTTVLSTSVARRSAPRWDGRARTATPHREGCICLSRRVTMRCGGPVAANKPPSRFQLRGSVQLVSIPLAPGTCPPTWTVIFGSQRDKNLNVRHFGNQPKP